MEGVGEPVAPRQYFPKSDRFTKVRGGTSKLLHISCSNCGSDVALYQKDGPGKLIRTYTDKFLACCDEGFLETTKHAHNIRDMKNFVCPRCGQVIGVPMVYQPENRLAYRLVHGNFSKRQSKDGYFPPRVVEDQELELE